MLPSSISSNLVSHSNHAAQPTLQTNSVVSQSSQNLCLNNASPTSQIIVVKKKKKKKSSKERKPRPKGRLFLIFFLKVSNTLLILESMIKAGEIRLKTALDGSSLFVCPECQMGVGVEFGNYIVDSV